MTAQNAFPVALPPPGPDSRPCARPGCSERFQPARAHARFCSDACRAATWKLRAEANRLLAKASDPDADPVELAAALRAEANRLMAGSWKRGEGGRFAGRRK